MTLYAFCFNSEYPAGTAWFIGSLELEPILNVIVNVIKKRLLNVCVPAEYWVPRRTK